MGLLDIGIAGLQVSQTSLQVTGNNISNADLPEYSRQRTEVVTRPEQLRGGGYLGQGAIVEDITRVVDDFLIKQIRLDTGTFTNLEIITKNLEQLDALLAADGTGLSVAISDFYSALEASAQDPTSEPARQVVMSQAEALVQRFNTVSGRVEQQAGAVNDQLDSLTRQVTTLALGIAEMNQAIEDQIAKGAGAQPNQLLDKREDLLRQMAELISVNTVQDGNSINVFVGNGQPLVIKNQTATLDTVPSTREPGNEEIVYIGQNGATQQITDYISGGKIGGLLEFRDEVITLTLNSLGRLALAISDTLNQQNRLGIDLEGNLGDDIFLDINSGLLPPQRVIADSNNSGTGAGQARITDVTQLTVSDYTLVWNTGVDYQLIRNSDGNVVSGTVVGFPATIVSDGFEIDVLGAPAAGDQFYIRPTRTAATSMEMDIQRLQELAYAFPITANASAGNTGNGIISQGSMIEVLNGVGEPFEFTGGPGPQLQPPTMIRFTTATNYTVYNNTDPANPVVMFGGSIIPGQVNDVFLNAPGALPQYTGYQVQLSGVPAAGDEFTIEFNANGTSDNRNALQLGQTRVRDILDNGSTNFENAYGSLIEEIGTNTAQSQISQEAAESLLLQSQARRDAISGVNLDEEASNLIKFEQMYNASAQLISVARQIFDTLLASVRT